MKKSKRIISMILAVIMLSMTAIGVNAEELIVGFDDLLEVVGIIEHDHEEEELMPMATSGGCSYVDATTLHELFDDLGYTYEGKGKETVLDGGYTYSTGYSHNYINVFIYQGDELIGSYRISAIG